MRKFNKLPTTYEGTKIRELADMVIASGNALNELKNVSNSFAGDSLTYVRGGILTELASKLVSK